MLAVLILLALALPFGLTVALLIERVEESA